MKLSTDEIKNITYGACFVHETEKGLIFDRFSDDQKPLFHNPEKYFGQDPFFFDYFVQNCRTNSCVMLDFITDSENTVIDIGAVESINDSKNNYIVILRNGKQVKISDKAEAIEMHSNGKNTRYTVYFPYFAEVALKGITVDDNCNIEAARSRKLWLMLGDSITHGVGATLPTKSYAGRAAYRYDGEVINQGNSGYVHDANILEPIYDLRSGEIRVPNLITSAYGINDRGRKSSEDNYNGTLEYFTKLKEIFPKSRIVMIAPIWATLFEGKDEDFAEMHRMYCGISEKLGIEIINGGELVPHNARYFVDGVHPSDGGYAYYASRLIKKMKI